MGTITDRQSAGVATDVANAEDLPVAKGLVPLVGHIDVSSETFSRHVRLRGVSMEQRWFWTNGETAEISFMPPAGSSSHIAVLLDMSAFIWPQAVPRQAVTVSVGDRVVAEWSFIDRLETCRSVVLARQDIGGAGVTLTLSVPTCAQPKLLGINEDDRRLGVAITGMSVMPLQDPERLEPFFSQRARKVGIEATKSFDYHVISGFWSRFITGPHVLDVGFQGGTTSEVFPIVDGAIGIDLGYPGYDGKTLPFPDGSQDAVYSSHCLEHIPHYIKAIQEWYRVTKPGGHIITVVPNMALYEKRRRPPSRWNGDHQRFYTPASLLAEFERALPPNSFRVRHLAENDRGYDYQRTAEQPPAGCYEIELVVQKIPSPTWRLDD